MLFWIVYVCVSEKRWSLFLCWLGLNGVVEGNVDWVFWLGSGSYSFASVCGHCCSSEARGLGICPGECVRAQCGAADCLRVPALQGGACQWGVCSSSSNLYFVLLSFNCSLSDDESDEYSSALFGRCNDEFALELDFEPFNESIPRPNRSSFIGNGVQFLNRHLSSKMFHNRDCLEPLLDFLRAHRYKGHVCFYIVLINCCQS